MCKDCYEVVMKTAKMCTVCLRRFAILSKRLSFTWWRDDIRQWWTHKSVSAIETCFPHLISSSYSISHFSAITMIYSIRQTSSRSFLAVKSCSRQTFDWPWRKWYVNGLTDTLQHIIYTTTNILAVWGSSYQRPHQLTTIIVCQLLLMSTAWIVCAHFALC